MTFLDVARRSLALMNVLSVSTLRKLQELSVIYRQKKSKGIHLIRKSLEIKNFVAKMSRSTLSRSDRVAQMTKQEELIAKKRQELLEKQKTAELAKAVAASQNSMKPSCNSSGNNQAIENHNEGQKTILGTSRAQNNFCNDGSFLANFKKIFESAKRGAPANNLEKKEITDKESKTCNIDGDKTTENDINTGNGYENPVKDQKEDIINTLRISASPTFSENHILPLNNTIGEMESIPFSKSTDSNVNPTFGSSFIHASVNTGSCFNGNPSFHFNPNIPPPGIKMVIPPPPPPPPLPSVQAGISSNASAVSSVAATSTTEVFRTDTLPYPLHLIPPPDSLKLSSIPHPKELDLNAIPKPEMNVETIKMPDTKKFFSDYNDQILPTTLESLIALVAEKGDEYEDYIRTRKNDVHSSLWFLFDKKSEEYKEFKNGVNEHRTLKMKENNGYIRKELKEDEKYDPESICCQENENNDKSDDSDTEYMKSIAKKNRQHLKRKFEEKNSLDYGKYNSDDSDDNSYEDDKIHKRFISKNKCSSMMNSPSNNSSSSSCSNFNSNKSATSSENTITMKETNLSLPKKRKSRWGEKVDPKISAIIQTNFGNQNKPLLTVIKRTDPALLQYARQNYGTTDLTEEDWKKCEDHYKVNILYQDMMNKRKEIDRLSRIGKFKYDYDSDEDTAGGTWEHKLRTAEMEATKAWAEALTRQSEGKHHIGDFLPPEELRKFMEKYNAKKNNRQPDLSDYKEFKLKEDNIGFQMLQKLGWKEGQGLGATGEGIVNPINKAPQREANQGLGAGSVSTPDDCDNEYEAYRKRMMLAYRFRPNPLNNPRRAYY